MKHLMLFFTILLNVMLPNSGWSAEDQNIFLKNEINDGVSNLKAKNNSIEGEFEFEGTKIFVETRRGKKTAASMRKLNPDFPLYEIDIRLSDENGIPFFVQTGGHEPMEPSWGSSFEELTNSANKENKEDAQKLFASAKELVNSLRVSKFRSKFIPEQEAIVGILALIEGALIIEKVELDDDTLKASYLSQDRNTIEIWSQGAYIAGNIFGDHSATVAKAISANGYTYQIWSSKNHGASPGTGRMTKKCSNTFYNRGGFCQAEPMCSTPFQGDQKDWWNDDYRHVCNDDTYIQYYRIKYNTNPDTKGGTCSDKTFRNKAPSCW